MAEKTSDRAFPSRFGRYQLLDRLAAGGMAEVFRARSASDGNRLIAIKCMLPALVDDEEFANMFVDEAKLASQLSHPNIVQIYELGRFKEQLYIAMELIHGRDLRAIVRKAKKKSQALPPQFVAYVIAKTAEALDYAHRKTSIDGKPLKLVHRDVSPQNILVGYDGNVKVVDFGIAKADFRRTASRVGILKGKFAYMAPEQVKTGEVDGRTDIFALGAVLYESFAHRKLFYGESDFSILERVTNGTLPDEAAAWDKLPSQLADVVRRAVAVDAEQRYQEASLMSEALEPMLIDGRTVYGAKQARELMEGLFTQEIADNDQALRGFAATAGEASGILRRPSQRAEKIEKIEKIEEPEQPDRRDWSIVTRDPGKAAEDVEREQREQRERDSRPGHDASNTSTEHLRDSTRPERDRRSSGRQRSIEATQVMTADIPEPMPMAKSSSRSRSSLGAPVTETAGLPLINGVLGRTLAERKTRLTWAFTGGAVALLVLMVIVSIVKASHEGAPPPEQEEVVAQEDPADRPPPRITTTPLGEKVPSVEDLLPTPPPAPPAPAPAPAIAEAKPAPPPTAAPAPINERAGYLTVRTVDGRAATVFIDKKEVGQSPLVKYKLSLGEHIVRVVDKANRAKVLQVVVTPGNTKAKPAELEVKP